MNGYPPVNRELQSLIDLQRIDNRLADLNKRVNQIPDEIRSLDQSLEENQVELEAAEQAVQDQANRQRQGETDVDVLRDRLAKYRSQLMEVKTNKEYQAVLHEISATEEEISQNEDAILEGMLALDDADARLERVRRQVEERGKEIRSQREELEAFIRQAEAEAGGLRKQRAELIDAIPEELIRLYDRIATAREGKALALAQDQSCQDCHVRLRPQLFNEIKTNQRIITCESCNRILYYSSNS